MIASAVVYLSFVISRSGVRISPSAPAFMRVSAATGNSLSRLSHHKVTTGIANWRWSGSIRAMSTAPSPADYEPGAGAKLQGARMSTGYQPLLLRDLWRRKRGLDFFQTGVNASGGVFEFTERIAKSETISNESG